MLDFALRNKKYYIELAIATFIVWFKLLSTSEIQHFLIYHVLLAIIKVFEKNI